MLLNIIILLLLLFMLSTYYSNLVLWGLLHSENTFVCGEDWLLIFKSNTALKVGSAKELTFVSCSIVFQTLTNKNQLLTFVGPL